MGINWPIQTAPQLAAKDAAALTLELPRLAGLDDLLADVVGICVGLWVARGVWRW